MQHSKPYTIIPFGAPGSGKSHVLNKLIGHEEFQSSQSAASGVTKEIKSYTGPAFGQAGKKRLQAFDAPGVGDMELSLQQIVDDIKASIQSTETTFDAALIVLKIFDYRATVQEIIALRAVKTFFENFSPT